MAGKTVSQVRAAADNHLATGSNSLGCAASDLNNALDIINNQFDNCGMVIACIDASATPVTAPGVLSCP